MPRVKKILNFHEQVTNVRLKEVCHANGAWVCQKMRIADVLNLDGSGVDSNIYTYGLKAHFDFVICENNDPLFAVEFDGPGHSDPIQKGRDDKKNIICEVCDFPILRINAEYLTKSYRGYDLLGWCVEYWFLNQSIIKAQKDGHLPLDDGFSPTDVIVTSDGGRLFPMWLSLETRQQLHRLYKEGRCRDQAPSHWVGVDGSGNYRGLMWVCVDDSRDAWVCVRSGARAQLFPVVISEFICEIMTFELLTAVEMVLEQKHNPVSGKEIDQAIEDYQKRYSMRSAAGLCRGGS